jgi:hypothetical protein
VLDLTGKEEFIAAKEQHSGNFDDHIAKSIPTYYDTQIKKGDAIADTMPDGGLVLDIAGSEGSFGKAITIKSDGKVRTVTLDPNQQMKKTFQEKGEVKGAEFVDEAFLQGFEDVPAYAPTEVYSSPRRNFSTTTGPRTRSSKTPSSKTNTLRAKSSRAKTRR